MRYKCIGLEKSGQCENIALPGRLMCPICIVTINQKKSARIRDKDF